MFQRGTVGFLKFLRETQRMVNPSALRVNEWVDRCVDSCVLEGKAVSILTQWCVSKNLEKRREAQGGVFRPTRLETRLFGADLPRVQEAAARNGIQVDWLLTLNRPYLRSWLVAEEAEQQYQAMLSEVAAPCLDRGWLLISWGEELIPGVAPNPEILSDPLCWAGEKRVERWTSWMVQREESDGRPRSEVERDAIRRIACEAEEGKLLASECGDWLLFPLEAPERFDCFEIFCRDFKKRIVAVLPQYPWRFKEEETGR